MSALNRYLTVEFLSCPQQPFTDEEATAASAEWNFNCGPGALCAVLGLKPADVRPFLGDFEAKGYTNPTLMRETLGRLGVECEMMCCSIIPNTPSQTWPAFGLARVQWGGPWTKPGVPMRARYRKTHWVGSWRDSRNRKHAVYDVNAGPYGGWLPLSAWAGTLVPWLLSEVEPKADGRWWLTHTIEVPVTHYGKWAERAAERGRS